MQIECNGELMETKATTVAELLAERQIDTKAVAVAVNGEFVPRARHADSPLSHGMKLEIVAPMQGG